MYFVASSKYFASYNGKLEHWAHFFDVEYHLPVAPEGTRVVIVVTLR